MTVKFTRDHEWIRIEGGEGTVGITDYAQQQLGDVVYVELPAAGKSTKKGDQVAVVESVKAASEIYAPASGTISAVNDALAGNPGTVNSDPAGEGWFYKLTLADPGELADTMDEAAYKAYVDSLD